jgi:hypothetical protein
MRPEWTIRPRRVMRTYLVRLLSRSLSCLPDDTLAARSLIEDIKRALDQESRAGRRAG